MSAVRGLDDVIASLPGGVARRGQQQMAEAVEAAFTERRHLIVQAGTGTGKSLAYLVPSVMGECKVVISTATKTLQNQLDEVDLPLLQSTLDPTLSWAVMKGRQSFACLAKLAERFGSQLDTAPLIDDAAFEVARAVREHPTGDRDHLGLAVDDGIWRGVSVSGMECPGANACPQGEHCFAELAAERARSADIVITNHHLYALDMVSGGRILPPHDAVVFDEAHKLETALSSAFGVDITAGRLTHFAGQARHIVGDRRDRNGRNLVQELRECAAALRDVLSAAEPGRVDPSEGPLGSALHRSMLTAATTVKRVRERADDATSAAGRVQAQGGHLAGDIGFALDRPDGSVAWIERDVLRVAPIEVAPRMAAHALVHRPAILTSATLTSGGSFLPLASRLGLVEVAPEPDPHAEDVESPVSRTYHSMTVDGAFDYPRQGLLYVAAGLPDPRDDSFVAAALDEITALVEAAGGRSLTLTTSMRMVESVAMRLERLDYPVIVQGQIPRSKLIAAFAEQEQSVLVATMGYWEGIDVPGPSLSLVIIDKLPFPRPDDPLAQARREAVERRGGSGFNAVDLPHATMLLAQGVGRLIRSETDRGVVAILDNRLSKKRYGQKMLRSLPRMLRTSDRERALRFLRDL